MAVVWSISFKPIQEDRPDVLLYTLKHGDLQVDFMNWGATITSILVPDKAGKLDDVVLGFDTLDGYKGENNCYFGAIVGRVANRIAQAQFTLDGQTYKLAANNGPNCLHGGIRGFDKVLWKAEAVGGIDYPALKLTYHSADGEEGFPGDVDVTVVYSLPSPYELRTVMTAVTSKPTPISLANHTYWNLSGHASGDILKHTIELHGSKYTPVDNLLIPTGQIDEVTGTPFDFLTPQPIGSRIAHVPGGGYDHNYVVDDDDGGNGDGDGGHATTTGSASHSGLLHLTAVVHDPASGREMTLKSSAPGVQFYTGNFVDCPGGKGGAHYKKHSGLCLETQGFPDAINQPGFPSVVLRPGETYRHEMSHRFTCQ